MSDIFINYLEEVKRLISENYEPADLVTKEFEKTTSDLVCDFRNIIPGAAIDEFIVYEALKQLKFEPKETAPLSFIWFFKRKKEE